MARLFLYAKYFWAWCLLTFEALGVAFWKIISWTLFFFGLWLFDIPATFGDWGRYSASILFTAGFVYLFYRSKFSFPRKNSVRRRLETDSGIKHRPLDQDHPAYYLNDNSQSLWRQNQNFLKELSAKLKWSTPRPKLAHEDPFAVRFLLLLLFISGFLVSGSMGFDRIRLGFFPFLPLSAGLEKRAPNLALWITPPDYTGQQQIALYNGHHESISVPAYSHIKATVKNGVGTPTAQIRSYTDDPVVQEWIFDRLDSKDFAIEFPLPENLSDAHPYIVSIRQMFFPRLQQEFTIIPDLPPSLLTKSDPESLASAALRFSLEATDDYGIESLTMHMQLDPIIDAAPLGEPVSEMRIAISAPNEPTELKPSYNLAHHSWAGLPVRFSFEVMDARGQVAYVGPIYTKLPEKHFKHPIAKKLIEYRKRFTWEPQGQHQDIAQELELILMRPDLFQYDLIATLAIRSAASRLYYTPKIEAEQMKTSKALVKLLWDTALRIEDGDLSLAARNLRTAKERLQEALQDPSISDAEKAMLLDDLKQAMAEYFQELQRELQKRMAQQNPDFQNLINPQSMDQMLSNNALNEFLQKMQEQIMNGDMNNAQDMLSQLDKFMEMMDPSMMQEMPQDMQMMQQGINELQELIDRQQDLLDQTTQQESMLLQQVERLTRQMHLPKDMQDHSFEIPDMSAHKTEQDALRFVLGQLMLEAAEKIGNIPDTMGKAEMEMRDSADKLGKSMPGPSIPHQEQAIEYLQEAQDSLSQQLSQRMQQMMVFSIGQPSGGQPYAPGRYDPLGRPYDPNGQQDGDHHSSDVEVPDEMNRRRVQEIQKLLRDRSGEHDRPELEREYYRRLLKQF